MSPAVYDRDALADQILLEQFQNDLEKRTQRWVHQHSQKTKEDRPVQALLQPLLIIDILFSRIARDMVGPLPRRSTEHHTDVRGLRHTIPQGDTALGSDGTLNSRGAYQMDSENGNTKRDPYQSRVELCVWSVVGRVPHAPDKTSVHLCVSLTDQWSRGTPQWNYKTNVLVTFAIQHTPQESMEYSPFKLILGHCPRGLLQAIRED